jgi:predicted dehydrogenase
MPDVASKSGFKISFGMIGGGMGSAIGTTHRNAAQMDDLFAIKAGVFSSDHGRGVDFGTSIGVAPERCYPNVEAMVEAEAGCGDGIRLATIVTPNALHASAARVLLQNRMAVLCEKPMTISLAEAVEVAAAVRQSGAVFALAHGYSGYAMVREARALISAGAIGRIVMVQAQYASGSASRPVDENSRRGAIWRGDPAQAGPSSVLGDIGTHAHHMVRFVTGLEIVEVAAELTAIVPDRKFDDTAQILIRLENGACGMMWVTMAAAGGGNELGFKIYGETGHIEWNQEVPDILTLRKIDGNVEVRRRAMLAGEVSAGLARRRPGQPEGLVDAFANLYRDIAAHMNAPATGRDGLSQLPGVTDGVLGMAFIEAAIKSSAQGSAWTRIEGL